MTPHLLSLPLPFRTLSHFPMSACVVDAFRLFSLCFASFQTFSWLSRVRRRQGAPAQLQTLFHSSPLLQHKPLPAIDTPNRHGYARVTFFLFCSHPFFSAAIAADSPGPFLCRTAKGGVVFRRPHGACVAASAGTPLTKTKTHIHRPTLQSVVAFSRVKQKGLSVSVRRHKAHPKLNHRSGSSAVVELH